MQFKINTLTQTHDIVRDTHISYSEFAVSYTNLISMLHPPISEHKVFPRSRRKAIEILLQTFKQQIEFLLELHAQRLSQCIKHTS